MRINHNIAALNTYNKLSANTAATSKSLEKLSSGLKINKAGDNAAGLAISEKMRGQIRGLDQASTNASDAISLINTAEGALSETHSILQRMRELAVQSSNDTNVTVDRDEIQKEMNQLTSEINRIGNTTEFNTQKLLNGDKKVIADTAAKVVGNTDLGSSVGIRATKLYNTATSSGITYTTATSDIGATATGTKTLSGGTATALTQNELTLTVSGLQKTVVVASGLNLASGTLISGLNTALDTAFGAGKVTASIVDNKLKLTVDGGALADISIDGGGMAKLLFGDDLSKVNYTEGVNSGSQYLGIHTATKATVTGSAVVNTAVSTDGTHNELTMTVNNQQKTFAVASGLSGAALLSGLNTALSGAFGAGNVTASFTAAGKLELTTGSGGASQSISIDGGNMAGLLFGTTTAVAGQDANNKLSFKVGGVAKELTIASDNYTSASGAAEALQKAIDGVSGLGAQIQASVVGGKVVLSSKTVGTTITDFGGTAAAGLGFTNATIGSGLLENNSFTIAVDGGTAKTITLSGGNYSNSGLVSALQTKIDAEINPGKAKVTLANGKLSISTVSAEGLDSTIAISGATEFFKAVGFNGSSANDAGEEGKGTSVTFQIGANTAQSMAIQIEDMRSSALKISSSGGGTVVSKDGKVTANYVDISKGKSVNNGTDDEGTEYALDVSTYQNATNAITILDDAIASVSSERSKLGSYQNRLEHTINNLGTSSENLTTAESRIRDVDMAKEMMEFTKNNILSQAAQSMLAQANQQPQGVLQLLQ